MISTICDIVNSIAEFFSSVAKTVGLDLLFIIALAVEALIVLFFLVKSAFSYESALNRCLDKLNFWLFERKMVTEENIKELNYLFKTKAPKRLCYYWQQYILFREGAPSSYLSTENLIEKPLKTSSYNSNIKNLTIFSGIWALISGLFVLIVSSFETLTPTGKDTAISIMVPIFVLLIGVVFIAFLRARKNAVLNSLYQNVTLFGRFMDNACLDLPSYIDYQLLFTPEEIEKGQPVLREFLDYKARKEKEEFNKAKEDLVEVEKYNFEDAGIDGSIVLERAMKESELFLKKKEKILVQISQLEGELDSRRKNFDNVQKDYQTKLQASKENVTRLRQMQEETTNRIESNYYRKQQTQEVGKQEQLEQEFEGLRAKYLLEKNECEEEIKKLNAELAGYKKDVETAMKSEYSTFFDRFCKSAEKVVGKVFEDKINGLKAENERDKQTITELEIKMKNMPQGQYDGASEEGVYDENGNFVYPNGTYYDPNGYFHDEYGNVYTQDGQPAGPDFSDVPPEGKYDEQGNFLYPNGTYYDANGYFHDEYGNVYTQDGQPVSVAQTQPQEQIDQPQTEEKKVVDFENLDAFELVNDESQKEKVFDVAESVVKNLDKNNEIEIKERQTPQEEIRPQEVEAEQAEPEEVSQGEQLEPVVIEESAQPEQEKPRKKAGRPRKVVTVVEEPKPARKPGRPRKIVQEDVAEEKKKPGRPKKIQPTAEKPKRSAGRPRKVVVEEKVEKKKPGRPKKVQPIVEQPKRAVGRPKKVVEPKQETVVVAEKKKPGRPKKIVAPAQVEDTAPKRGRGRPKKESTISDIDKQLSQEEASLKASKQAVDKELKSAIDGFDVKASGNETREELLRQIDELQAEAQEVIARNGSDTELAQINSKLEDLLNRIQNAQ